MEISEFKTKLEAISSATDGMHRLIPKFQSQLKKPVIIGYWAEKIESVLLALPKKPGVLNEKSPKILNESFTEIPSDPDVIKRLKAQAKSLHKEEAHLHQLLCASNSIEKRHEIALKICKSIGPALDNIYSKIKEYNRTGNIPDQNSLIRMDKKSMTDKMNSIKSRISRLQKLVKTDGSSKYHIELKEKEQLLNEIKDRIEQDC